MITISTLVLATATALTAAQTGEAELTVSVTGIQQAGGQLVVGLYASGEDWDSGNAAAGQYVPVEGDGVSFTFADLPAGTYGIKLYHDVDGDGDMDTNLMGIPTEPFGFSNNARGRFGPASWDDAVFTIEPGSNAHALDLR